MTSAELFTYVLVLAAAAAVPGPDIAAICARALAAGFSRCLTFIAGIVTGHAIWTIAAALGLVALVKALGPAFVAVKFAAAAYLVYLAWQLWTAPVDDTGGDAAPQPKAGHGFLPGLLVSLSNPKAFVFFGAVMPTVLPLETLSPAGLGVVIAASSATMLIVFSGWAAIADRARAFLRNASSRRMLNRSSAVVMAGAGVAVAMR